MKRGVAAALILGVALAVGLLSGLGCSETAHPILYVSEAGEDSGDCADPASPCRTIQRAVDLAEEGDEIRVAGGTYSGVGSRDGLTQTIYLDKGIVLRGGYPPGDWEEPDPEANPTVLDARGDGQGPLHQRGGLPCRRGLSDHGRRRQRDGRQPDGLRRRWRGLYPGSVGHYQRLRDLRQSGERLQRRGGRRALRARGLRPADRERLSR